jgi:hypothetical protein
LIRKITLFITAGLFFCIKSFGQLPSSDNQALNNADTSCHKKEVAQKDLGEVVNHWLHPSIPLSSDTVIKKDTRKHFSFVPAVGYTLQTGFAGIISGNMAWNTDTAIDNKVSSVNTNVTYSQYRQTIIPFQASIWTKGNRYNIITDLRYINYPSAIYGLGGRTDPNKGHTIDFSGIKIHQTVMKDLSSNFYAGLGFYYDKFWNVEAIDSLSRGLNLRLEKELGKQETASGIVGRFLYDSRLNQINPQQGVYLNITYRDNIRALGSDSNWQSLLIDCRTYFHFPQHSHNVLAFWMMDWLTTAGTPPYLLLPSTGWDDNYNTGRGYIQGRFRGNNMVYFESEYRFGLTRDGLVGGVAFFNLQHFSSEISTEYNKIFPGYGAGLRVKLNKHSGANLAVDYGFGLNGSKGFFVNLGEVF